VPRAPYVPDRGDFVRLVLTPQAGREQSGERPALVLSGRAFNEITGLAFVAAITSRMRGWPFEVQMPLEGRIRGVVLADQTRSLDFAARHARFLGKAPDALVRTVLERVVLILEISN
jgi:mRNA interferase MazF